MKIAIIGSGISGMGAAYLLHSQHDITLYEKNDYIGGHSRTVTVNSAEGPVPVDTGFIVFNYRNYPLLTGLFEHLQVPVAKSDMSFAASIDDGWLEYGTQYMSNIFAQKRNLLRPAFWRMIADILRFNREALAYRESDITLGECLDTLNMGPWFRDYFLLAMGAAIWSTPMRKMPDYPARSFIRFFENHGLLTVNDQPQWYTVQGGSREYVRRLTADFADRIRLNCAVASVTRTAEGVTITDGNGQGDLYDQVIFACHSDQALKLLDNPTAQEKAVLEAVRYQPNRMVLHSDESFMPKRKKAWASWVYLCEGRRDENPSISLSYWMNRLQPLPTQQPMIVTLNPGREPDPAKVHDEALFAHPLYDEAAIQAQAKVEQMQGQDRLWYCGAWQRFGFHEDGLQSAVRVAQKLGAEIPWK